MGFLLMCEMGGFDGFFHTSIGGEREKRKATFTNTKWVAHKIKFLFVRARGRSRGSNMRLQPGHGSRAWSRWRVAPTRGAKRFRSD